MINSKQRAYLRKLANNLEPSVLIGKGEVDDDVLNSIFVVLQNKELVKISLLQNCGYEPKNLINEIAQKLSAEPVACVGRKMVLYKRSTKKGVEHIEINI